MARIPDHLLNFRDLEGARNCIKELMRVIEGHDDSIESINLTLGKGESSGSGTEAVERSGDTGRSSSRGRPTRSTVPGLRVPDSPQRGENFAIGIRGGNEFD